MRRNLLLLVTLFFPAAAAYGQEALPAGQVGVPYDFNFNPPCINTPNCSLPYLTAGALPPGLNFGSATYAFSIVGIPTQVGVFNFTLGGQNIGPASITILPGPPAVVPEVLPDAGVGVPYNAPISATAGNPPYNWILEGSLPPGLALVSSSAGEAIVGTPTQAGVFMATLFVVDARGTMSASAQLKISVAQIVIRNPSGVIISALPGAQVGTSYSAQFAVQYGSGAFTITSGALPPGLLLDPGGGLSGTPTAAGTFPFTVTAGGAVLSTSINVASLIPAFSTTSLPGGTVGQFYYQRLTVTGGSPPYTYTGSGVPPGLIFELGLLSGTPTAAGTFQMTFTATDTANRQGSTQLALTVYPPLTMGSASSLPPATAGQPYSQTISVTGGQPPYTFVLSGTAPAGFAVNSQGVLTGTPAAPGSYTFTIQVTDNLQNVASRSYQLAVGLPQPGIVAGGILNAASFAEDSKGHGTASAPGSLVSIYGNYPGATQATAGTTAALPTSLGGATVTFNGVPAPLVSIFPSGASPVINAQIPFEVLAAGASSGQPSGTASVVVTINGQSSAPQSSPIAPFAPGIFTIPPDGLGTAILVFVDPADQIVKIAAPASASSTFGLPTAPIPRGASGFFYVTGLGAMTPPVADGDGGGTITHFANVTPVVLVGGAVATEIFAGQAPGYPGIGQVNLTIPDNAPVGDAVPLQLQSADGTVTSNIATIAVQ